MRDGSSKLPQEFFEQIPEVESRVTNRRRQVPRKKLLALLFALMNLLCLISLYFDFKSEAKNTGEALWLLGSADLLAMIMLAFHQLPWLRVWVRGQDPQDDNKPN